MRTITAIVMLLLCQAAQADGVRIKKLMYSDVQVVDFANGELHFRGLGNNRIVKPIAEVTLVSIDGRPALNKAELLLADGKAADAAAAYNKATEATTGWLAELVQCRRLVALDRAGQIDKAAEQWLLLSGRDDGAWALKLRPTNLAPKGSGQNRSAIALLVQRRKQVAHKHSDATAIDALLMDLYQRQGRTSDAAAVAARIADLTQTAPATATRPAQTSEQLKAMAVLASQGQPGEVLGVIKANLRNDAYTAKQLPMAILLAGRAQQLLAEAADPPSRRKLLIAAGLDFMRVATFYPGSQQAPEAMLRAGQVNAALGNRWAAGNAWRLVIKKHPASQAAAEAAKTIEQINSP